MGCQIWCADQAKALYEANGCYMDLECEQRLAIVKYNDDMLNGLLPKRFTATGIEILYTPAPGMYDEIRKVSPKVISILKAVHKDSPAYSYKWRFPGVMSFNEHDQTVNVILTMQDYLKNKTTAMKFGKYLKRLETFTDSEINTYANAFKSTILLLGACTLEIATGQDIIDIYKNGPNSCMSGDGFFSGHIHPAAVYDSPDIACAYVRMEDRIVARAMINLVDNLYSYPYGNECLIEPLLEKEGYKSGSLEGCRIRAIPLLNDNRAWIMPYIDGADTCYLQTGGEWFVIENSRNSIEEVYCTNTNGTTQSGIACEHCGDYCEDDDSIYIDDFGTVCSHYCAEESGYVACVDDWDTYHHANIATFCGTDDSWYISTDDLVCIDSTWYKSDDDRLVWSDEQDEYLIEDDAVYIDSIDSWVDCERECDFEEEEEEVDEDT